MASRAVCMVMFPSPYRVILITHIPERSVSMRPFNVLCGWNAKVLSFWRLFCFLRKTTFWFALMRLSPILNHASCAHLHQLIIISSALYMWGDTPFSTSQLFLSNYSDPAAFSFFVSLRGYLSHYIDKFANFKKSFVGFRPLTGLSISLLCPSFM